MSSKPPEHLKVLPPTCQQVEYLRFFPKTFEKLQQMPCNVHPNASAPFSGTKQLEVLPLEAGCISIPIQSGNRAKIGIRNVSLGDFCFFFSVIYSKPFGQRHQDYMTPCSDCPQVMLLVSHGARLWEKFHRSSLYRLPSMFIISLSEVIKPLGYQYKSVFVCSISIFVEFAEPSIKSRIYWVHLLYSFCLESSKMLNWSAPK